MVIYSSRHRRAPLPTARKITACTQRRQGGATTCVNKPPLELHAQLLTRDQHPESLLSATKMHTLTPLKQPHLSSCCCCCCFPVAAEGFPTATPSSRPSSSGWQYSPRPHPALPASGFWAQAVAVQESVRAMTPVENTVSRHSVKAKRWMGLLGAPSRARGVDKTQHGASHPERGDYVPVAATRTTTGIPRVWLPRRGPQGPAGSCLTCCTQHVARQQLRGLLACRPVGALHTQELQAAPALHAVRLACAAAAAAASLRAAVAWLSQAAVCGHQGQGVSIQGFGLQVGNACLALPCTHTHAHNHAAPQHTCAVQAHMHEIEALQYPASVLGHARQPDAT